MEADQVESEGSEDGEAPRAKFALPLRRTSESLKNAKPQKPRCFHYRRVVFRRQKRRRLRQKRKTATPRTMKAPCTTPSTCLSVRMLRPSQPSPTRRLQRTGNLRGFLDLRATFQDLTGAPFPTGFTNCMDWVRRGTGHPIRLESLNEVSFDKQSSLFAEIVCAGQEFKCEICGNFSYWGRRAFERHFSEWRHSFGMQCLRIPNTTHFKVSLRFLFRLSYIRRVARPVHPCRDRCEGCFTRRK